MVLLIGFLSLSIIFSFLCSIWEAVLLSITPSYIKKIESESPETSALIASLKNDIDKPMGSVEFYQRLAIVLREVRQGHLLSRPPARRYTKAELKVLNKLKFEFNDLDFEVLENKLWIKGTLGKDSTMVGDEVLAVDKESSKKLVEKYKGLFSSDGFNTTYHNRYVGRNFSNFYYSENGFRDSLTLLLKKADSIYFKTFRWIGKGSAKKKDSSTIKEPKKISKTDKVAFKEKQRAKKRAGRKWLRCHASL